MEEYDVHQKLKYGDLVYIEFTYKKKRTRNIITGGEFKIKGKFDVEIKKLDLSNNSIYLKDFEENLFIIFPKMKDEFMNNRTFLNNGLSLLKEKMKISKGLAYDLEFKNNITKVIRAFQETKENVYSENEKFMEEIGKPINYEDDFILIHFKTQCFVKRNVNNINNKSSALILTPLYSDECVFFFAQSSSFNLNINNVFSNTNVFICKREKNIYSNSHFLIVKPINIDKTKTDINNYVISTNNVQKNNNDSGKNEYMREINHNYNNFVFDFNEGQGQIFQIKICSNYIDPSSSNLSFATPVWLMVQSIDRYLNITILPKTDISNNDFEPINPNYDKTSVNLNKNDLNTPIGINNLNYNINSAGQYSIMTHHSFNPTNNNNTDINNTNNNNINATNKTTNNNNDNQNINNNYEIGHTASTLTNNYRSSTLNNVNNNNRNLNHLPLNSYKISFDSTDKEKSINNINGLFFIEQYDEKDEIKSLTDEYLKEKLKLRMELKMPSYVEFHKTIRFRHITSKKYLGFQESLNDDAKTKTSNNKNNNNEINNESNKKEIKGKTCGTLILMDIPNEDCDWMFLESYKVLEGEEYLKSKINGVEYGTNENEEDNIKEESEQQNEDIEEKNESENSDKSENESNNSEKEKSKEKIHKIKNNEIIRIFHIKTQKFLCFDEVNNKIGEKNKTKTLIADDLYSPKIDKKIYVHNLNLTKVPYDSDLVRLIPSDVNQSLEISIVLYFKNQLNELIDYIIKRDYKKILGIENMRSLRGTLEVNTNVINTNINTKNMSNNNNTNNNDNNNEVNNINNNRGTLNHVRTQDYKSKKNIIIDLKALKDKTLELIDSFKNIIDYCLNNFSRKYDINISPGKALYYRQQYLFDQGLLKKIFRYLEYTKNLNEMYEEYNQFTKKKFEEEEEAEKLRNTINLNIKKSVQKTIKSIEKKNVFDLNNNPDFIILEIFKNISTSIKLCFEFIYSMCKNNSNNKKIAFNHKQLFLYYFLEYEEASKCFMDLLKENENIMNLINNQENKNNENVLESETGEDNIIDKILLYLNKSKNYERKNLSLLSKFLIIGDSGITSNQQYIFEELFFKGKDRFLIKIKPLYNDIEFKVVYRDENKVYMETNLIDFCNNRLLAERGLIKYLAEQLNLYANLCYGRNYVCIEKIRKIFPLDHLIYHISKVELNQEILAGLINILNYVYIDIEPHIMNVFPSLIKRVSPNLRIERIGKEKIKTYIPLNKLNLILCLSLFLLNNIKYGTVLVNTANINMIYNIIKFHLYENVVYSPLNISEVINNNLDQRLHNLKDEVKYNIIYGEELLINKKSEKNSNKKEMVKKNNEIMDDISDLISNNEEEHKLINDISNKNPKEPNNKEFIGNLNSFFNKYGYKFIDFNFESPIGEEYLLFVLDRINDFFLNSLIIANIDNNTEDKNIISQNFKSVSSIDLLTQSNINYLMDALINIKNILTKENNELNITYILIMKQIEKVINFILDIKTEDMSIYLLENLLKINYQLIDKTIEKKDEIEKNFEYFYPTIKEKLFDLPNIKDILMDNEYYYYQLFNKINFYDNVPKFFSGSNNSRDNEILSALLKRDKSQDENKRLLNNSLFSEEASLIEINKYKDIQELTNNYFSSNSNYINEGYHDSEYYYNLNMPNLDINFDNFFMNSVIFKNTIELIIRILEMNVNAKLTKILLRIFKRLISQRKELFDCIKNVLLLYKNNDSQKYYLCNISIKELSLLAEKTEKWMTEDHVPAKLVNMIRPEDINMNEIEYEQKDFFLVYATIYKYLSMIVDYESNTYYEDEEIKLIQKIYYSFQMENILSSLMKEIIQEYPAGDNNEDETLELKKKGSKGYLINTINSKYSVKSFLKKQKLKNNKYKENLYNKKQKEIVFKIALEKLLKIIFKLFIALIHNTSPNINEKIFEFVNFGKEYKYLLNFGLLQLIVELSSDEKFILIHIKYLLDLINEQLSLDCVKEIKNHFYDFSTYFQNDDFIVAPPNKNNIINSKKSFEKLLKKYYLLLKLMKNATTKVNDEKHIGRILEKYVDIITDFDLFNQPQNQYYLNYRQSLILNESGLANYNFNQRRSMMPTKRIKTLNTTDSRNNNYYNPDITCKTEFYRLAFVYYLIKITNRLIKKNQQLRQYLSNLISIRRLINFIFDLNPPFSKSQINTIIESKQYKDTKLFLKIQFYFKVKYIGCVLIFSLSRNSKENKKYMSRYIDKYYSKLNDDLEFVFFFRNQIERYGNFNHNYSNYNRVYEKYRNHMYKYFFKGIFPIIYYHLSIFSEKLFKNYEDYQRAKLQYMKINKRWSNLYSQLYNEKNKNKFKKLFAYLEHKKKEYHNVFNINDSSSNFNNTKIERRTLNYIKTLKQELVGPEENKLSTLFNDPNRHNNILFEMTINFVNDLISEIDNNEVVDKSIKREKKIMARHLKTKINFHHLLKVYIEENQQETEIPIGKEAEIHLVNIFLKFIQENSDNRKYFPVIKELIELMVYLVLVTPEIIKRENKVEKNNLNYFDQKVLEIKEYFFNQCQKAYLNNGAIETFLRIACQRGKYFHLNTFNMIIYFFKTILEGGNTDVQKKFIQLFQLLPNSDNLFMSIYQSFNKDIFSTLNSDPFIEEIKNDNINLAMITDKLRFLQLLTENHNLYLQNYLRNQTNNRISYNFLNILIEYLSMLLTKLGNLNDKYSTISRYCTELYYKRLLFLLDTICEFLQGPCKPNQEYLINTKVIELFNKIMEETSIITIDEDDDIKEINDNENYDQNTVFSLTNKTLNPDSFFSENITYSRGGGSDEELYFENNLQQNKIFSPLSDYQKSMLLFKISLVLLSIIEGRQTKDDVIRKVLRDINYKLVFEKCGEIYKKLKNEMIFFLFTEDNTKDIEDLDNKVVSEAGFNLYFLMQTLVSMENEETELKINSSLLLEGENKYDRIHKEKLQEIYPNSETIQKSIQFYSQNSLNIEILKDNEVFKVYCPRLHFFNAFDEKMKKDFDDNADRESIQSKLTYLLNKKEHIYMSLKQINVIEQKYGRFGPLKHLLIYQNKVKLVGFILVILMNILMFIGYNAEIDRDQKNVVQNVKIFSLNESSSTIILNILGVIILVFDIIIFLEFITKDAVLIYKNLHRKFLRKSYENKIGYISDMEIHRIYDFLKSSGYSLYCHKIMIYIKLFFNFHVLYSICYMVFAILGLFVHHFFFSFHLIELIITQPILKYVFLAFYEPLADFLFTLIFFFILIYFYSLLIFYRYYELMPDYSCDSPLICMMFIYSNTFTSGGNLGNFIDTKEESQNISGDMERYILDISYTLIMVSIVWQMVSGLILDAFDNLRGDREEIEEDMETNCFICGLNREKIEKYYIGKEGFEKHLQDHSVENYLLYMFYLEDKDPNEYSGLESYVKENIDKESIIWFPIGRSLKIEEWENKHKS